MKNFENLYFSNFSCPWIHFLLKLTVVLAGNYMFKVNNRNARTKSEMCSKLTIKTPERR